MAAAPQRFRRLLRHFRQSIFGEFMGGARGSGAATRARRRPALRPRNHARGSLSRRRPDRSQVESPARCEPATASGAKPGTAAATLRDLRRPRQGPRAAGLLRGRADLPDLPRRRRDRSPTRAAPAAARAASSKRKTLDGQHPRRASTKAPASASPARARPACAARRRATSTSSSTWSGTRSSSARARPCSPRPISFTTAALGGCDRDPGPRRREARDQDPGRHPVGQAAAPARRRHAGAERPRPRRHGDPGRGRDADQAERQAAARFSSSSARPRPATNARRAKASSVVSRKCGTI